MPVCTHTLHTHTLHTPTPTTHTYTHTHTLHTQTLVLLASLVEHKGLHPLGYAEALARQFGHGWNGYRDASLKGFLRNWYRGRRPPRTGAQDWQANCFTRLAPLVAAFYAGGGGNDDGGDREDLPRLLTAVERATRVTQDADRAAAWARAGAAVLTRVVGGASVDDAVTAVVSELTDPATALGGGGARFREWNAEIAERLAEVQRMARDEQSVHATVQALGRNCHLPNSFQTPTHAALLYSLQAGSKRPSAMSAAERQALFKAAIRAALREGGCCASRATLLGACLGAWLGGGGQEEEGGVAFLPPEWTVRVTGFEATRRQAEALVGLRHVDTK
jgi:ADP-ribosylglycohydrolase